MPDDVSRQLRHKACEEQVPTEHFVDSRSRALSNLKALPTIWQKIRLLAQIAFPRPAYMKQRYQVGTPGLIGAYIRHLYNLARKYL